MCAKFTRRVIGGTEGAAMRSRLRLVEEPGRVVLPGGDERVGAAISGILTWADPESWTRLSARYTRWEWLRGTARQAPRPSRAARRDREDTSALPDGPSIRRAQSPRERRNRPVRDLRMLVEGTRCSVEPYWSPITVA
jgi:hypothetical protein